MPFLSPKPNSPADPNRHVCDLPKQRWRKEKRLIEGMRFQCSSCRRYYVWDLTVWGKMWVKES